jgi:hypothetical protein
MGNVFAILDHLGRAVACMGGPEDTFDQRRGWWAMDPLLGLVTRGWAQIIQGN